MASSWEVPVDAEAEAEADADADADALGDSLADALGLADAALGDTAVPPPVQAASVPRMRVRIPRVPATRPVRARASTSMTYLRWGTSSCRPNGDGELTLPRVRRISFVTP
jgi:hypothetical protein